MKNHLNHQITPTIGDVVLWRHEHGADLFCTLQALPGTIRLLDGTCDIKAKPSDLVWLNHAEPSMNSIRPDEQWLHKQREIITPPPLKAEKVAAATEVAIRQFRNLGEQALHDFVELINRTI